MKTGRTLTLALLLVAVATPAWAEYPIGTIGHFLKTTSDFQDGFITGFYMGAPMNCPNMTGGVLHSYFQMEIARGRATYEMHVTNVLAQIMTEHGCAWISIPPGGPSRF